MKTISVNERSINVNEVNAKAILAVGRSAPRMVVCCVVENTRIA